MQARTQDNGKHVFLNMGALTQLEAGSFMPTNCSSEASTSSTVISPASHDVSDAPCESSAQSNSPFLKEQDYIGMADVSSTTSMGLSQPKQLTHPLKLELGEPDLRLGLGPSSSKGAVENADLHLFTQLYRDNIKESPCIPRTRIDVPETTNTTFDVAHVRPHSSGSYAVPPSKRLDAIPIQSAFHPLTVDPHSKSVKRLFSDTIAQVPPDVASAAYVSAGAGREDLKSGAMFVPGSVQLSMQRPDFNLKPLSTQSQMLYWGTARVSSWLSEIAQNMSSHGHLPRKHNDSPLTMNGMLERALPNISNNSGTVPDEAPPAKEQVIGWPPVRSYRRSAINSGRSRPAGTASDVQAAIYVKVNMDGIPIGRKVDLNTYNNYDELLSALEEMFYSPPVGEGVRFLHAQDFVLTYEDKDGDWMLVGDVPWGMFINTVKRLRITRGSDSTCLVSSTSKNFS